MIKLLWVFLATCAVVVFGATESNNTSSPNGRIVGGAPASIYSFPYSASVQQNFQHRCGGIVVSRISILTSARCIISVPPANLQVRAGSPFYYTSGVLVGVTSTTIHENYNPLTLDFDIGIIRLQSSLPFGYPISTIPLTLAPPLNGSTAFISGWGVLTATGTTISPQLQYTEVNVIDRSLCTSPPYGYGTLVPITAFCGAATGRAACGGDYGGPLVVNGFLLGVASWGYGCADTNFPTIYTDVSQLNAWITPRI